MMPEVRELLICMVMVIAEQDIIQLILFDFLFQPMNISGKILAFQSDFDTDLIPVFLAERAQTFYVSG